jgi:hypothetical protein
MLRIRRAIEREPEHMSQGMWVEYSAVVTP